MKKYILTYIFTLLFLNQSNAQSPFQGTWKWDNSNQRLYVYILSKTLSTGDKVLRVDYKMVTISGSVETELYSSRFDNEFIWGGAILSEHPDAASGVIYDQTHPDTTDGIEGRFSLTLVPQGGSLPPKLRWKITKHSDYIQGALTDNPPSEFNLPIDILLTKI